MDNGDWEFGHTPADGSEQEITESNALVVIAQELRSIKRTLHSIAFDPNLSTTFSRIADELQEIRESKSKQSEEG